MKRGLQQPSRARFVAASAWGLGSAVLAARGSAADAFTLRMGITTNTSNEYFSIATHLARNIQHRTNGQLQVAIYPSSSLASQSQIIAALQSGVVDLTIQSNSLLSSVLPKLQVFDLPFMFKDAAAAYRVLDGPIGNEFFAELEGRGILGLAWGDDGFRQIQTTSRSIKVPDDMKGLRLRVQNGPLFTGMMQALGAIPVVLDANEIFIALQQKVIDGLEFPITAFSEEKLYTIAKTVAISNHNFTVSPLLASKTKLESLPANLQKIVRDEAKATRPYWEATIAERTFTANTFLKTQSLAFTTVDHRAFQKAMEPVYASLQARIGGDLIDRVRQISGGA